MKRWLILSGGVVAGLIIGYLLGAVISVNVFGVSYEASLRDIWKDDPTAIWVMAIIATTGGTAGGLLASRMSS